MWKSNSLIGQKLSLKGEDTYLLKEVLRYLLLYANKDSPTATALLGIQTILHNMVKSVNEQLMLYQSGCDELSCFQCRNLTVRIPAQANIKELFSMSVFLLYQGVHSWTWDSR